MATRIFGRAFVSASVDPDEETLGRVMSRPIGQWFRPDSVVDARTTRRLEEIIVIFLAGFEVEYRYRGRRDLLGAASDFQKAVDLASYLSRDDEELQVVIDELEARTRAMFADAGVWRAVTTFAHALAEARFLPYKQAKGIIDDALRPPL